MFHKSVHRRHRWSLALSFFLLSLLAVGSLAAESALGRQKNSSVWRLCQTSQGNGFNWASTLGWLSESLHIRAQEMKEAQETTDVSLQLDLSCFSGSSSAAASTALFAVLLNNESLVSAQHQGNAVLLDVEGVEILSRALRFMAVAADFEVQETVAFLHRYIQPRERKGNNWWKNQYGEDMIFEGFGKRILMAALLQREHINQPLPEESLLPGHPEVRRVTDLLVLGDESHIPEKGSEEHKTYSKLLSTQRKLILQTSRGLVEPYKGRVAGTVKALLRALPVPNGFVTATFAVANAQREKPSGESLHAVSFRNPPAFPQIQPMFLMNRNTAERLLRSEQFQSDWARPEFRLQGVVVGVVESVYDLMRLSVVEPETQELMEGSLRALAVSAVAEPAVTGFELRSEDQKFLILGGWTHYSDSAWPLVGLLESQEQATKVTLSRFGKPARTSRFPNHVIENYFFRNSDGSEPADEEQKAENVSHYTDLYYSRAEQYDTHAESVLEGLSFESFVNEYSGFNWDLSIFPAATSGKSQVLLMKSINNLRLQVSERGGLQLPLTFDPRHDSASSAN